MDYDNDDDDCHSLSELPRTQPNSPEGSVVGNVGGDAEGNRQDFGSDLRKELIKVNSSLKKVTQTSCSGVGGDAEEHRQDNGPALSEGKMTARCTRDQSRRLEAGQNININTNLPDGVGRDGDAFHEGFDHPLLDEVSILEIFQKGNRHEFFKSTGWSTRKFMNTPIEEARNAYVVWRNDNLLTECDPSLYFCEVKYIRKKVMDSLNTLTEKQRVKNAGRDCSGRERSNESFQNKIEEKDDGGFLVTNLKDLEKQHGIQKTVSSHDERTCLPDAVHQMLKNNFWTEDQVIPREQLLDKLCLQKYGTSWKECRNNEAQDFSILDMNHYLASEGRQLARPSFYRDFGLVPIFKQSKGCYLLLVHLSAVGSNWQDDHAIVYYAESKTLLDSTPNRKGLTIGEEDYNPTDGKAPRKAAQRALDFFLNLFVDDNMKVKGELRAFYEIALIPRKKSSRPAKQRPRSKKKRDAKKRARSSKK